MIYKLVTTISLCITVLYAKPQTSLTIDEIINKNIEARGGYAALKNIQTLIYSGGTYHEGDFKSDGNSFMAYKRPNYRIVGNPEDTATDILEGYDGGSWEWYATPGVVVRTVAAANATAHRGTDFEEPFVDYKTKGNTVAMR